MLYHKKIIDSDLGAFILVDVKQATMTLQGTLPASGVLNTSVNINVGDNFGLTEIMFENQTISAGQFRSLKYNITTNVIGANEPSHVLTFSTRTVDSVLQINGHLLNPATTDDEIGLHTFNFLVAIYENTF